MRTPRTGVAGFPLAAFRRPVARICSAASISPYIRPRRSPPVTRTMPVLYSVMRKVSGGSRLNSVSTRSLSLRSASAASSSALPKSTGPAARTDTSVRRRIDALIHHRTPAPSRKISIDDGETDRPHGQQRQSGVGLMQQKLSDAEQRAINQHTASPPAQEIGEPVARRLDVRRERGNRSPPCLRRASPPIESHQNIVFFRGSEERHGQPHRGCDRHGRDHQPGEIDRKSTRLNSSHSQISYAVF